MASLSFRTKLLLNITAIIFVVFLALTFIFYNYYSKVSLDNELLTVRHANERMNNQIDELFNQMSMSSLYITKTEFLQDILHQLYTDPSMSEYESITYFGQLRSQMNILTYYFPNASNVTIFNVPRSFYFQTGLPGSKEQIQHNLKDIEWYNSLKPQDSDIRIIPPHQDYWVKINRPVISIIRNILSEDKEDYGLLAFDIPYWNLENICNRNIRQETIAFIFDEDATLIYPYKGDSGYDVLLEMYEPHTLFHQLPESPLYGTTEINGQLHTYSFGTSEFTGWTSLLIHYPRTLIDSKRMFLILFTIFAAILLTVIVLAFYIAIRALTKPLYALMHDVRQVSIDNMSIDFRVHDVNELSMLTTSFNAMFAQLRDSINKIYESKMRETNARLLALQAQINPHFIYNTMSVISASAEYHGVSEVTIICDKLSQMLRYTSGSSKSMVPLEDELNHTINYLELIKMHYTDYDNPNKLYLTYDILLPDNMKQLPVPKMILQPLVENSVNHGFENSLPPWQVTIQCQFISNKDWSIILTDNGCGFSEASLKELKDKLNTYSINLSEGNLSQNSEIGGMGIMNTFSRLKIQYGTDFHMSLSNTESGGACYELNVTPCKEESSDD